MAAVVAPAAVEVAEASFGAVALASDPAVAAMTMMVAAVPAATAVAVVSSGAAEQVSAVAVATAAMTVEAPVEMAAAVTAVAVVIPETVVAGPAAVGTAAAGPVEMALVVSTAEVDGVPEAGTQVLLEAALFAIHALYQVGAGTVTGEATPASSTTAGSIRSAPSEASTYFLTTAGLSSSITHPDSGTGA